MDYKYIYDRLITRSLSRTLSGYSERHHVIPKCMGGNDSAENIAILTAPEHYVAHLLLVKIYPTNSKLVWAAVAMTNGTANQNRSGNKMYGWLRARLARQMSEREVTPETRAKLSQSKIGNQNMLGKAHSLSTKYKMSLAAQGRPKTSEHRQALSAARTGRRFGPRSEEVRRKFSILNKEAAKTKDFSFAQTPEYRQRQANQMKAVWAKRRLGLSPMPQSRFNDLIKGE